jgi:endoglucanase
MIRVLVALLLVAGCAHTPVTSTHPSPPAVTYAPAQHPFRDAKLYLDRDSTARRWQDEHAAPWLNPITTTPQARWLTSPEDVKAIPALARDARTRRQLLVLVAYYLPDRGCSDHREGAPTASAYTAWLNDLVRALGDTRAVIIMEPDAIPAECFTPERATILRAAVTQLVDARQYVYLDVGHSAWRSTGETASRLLDSGIDRAEGFSVNVSNRQTTENAHRWGLELADLVGNREFVIDTSRNGAGPPPGNPSEWCNPAHQGLGQPPTTTPNLPNLAALLWIKRPGESDGPCGGENTYLFTPRQARNLIVNSPWVPKPIRQQATDAPIP